MGSSAPESNFRAVLFDWDGTLVRSDGASPGAATTASVATLRNHGHGVTIEAFEAALAASLPPYVPGETVSSPRLDAVLAAALRALGVEPAAALIDACCDCFCAADCAAQQAFDDARAMVASLRYRGYRLAVVSNTLFGARHFEQRIAAAGLAGYFHAVICSADVGFSKPHPAPYRAALTVLGLEPAQALFVGDRADTDIAGAAAAGIPAVLLDRSRDAPDPAARVIDRLSGLTAYLGEGIRT
ncbi:MAG: HAD family hydrolase [Hyphomicrobiales bacterium]